VTEFVEAGRIFYAMRLHKHYSFKKDGVMAATVGQPGDYLVLDQFFNVLVIGETDFRKYFGKERANMLQPEFEAKMRAK
jgi:hypothetical protein